jgi:hypothetical protein
LVLSKSSFEVVGEAGCLSEDCERGRATFFLNVPGLFPVVGISTFIQLLDFSAVSITVSTWHKAVRLHRQNKKTMVDLIIA